MSKVQRRLLMLEARGNTMSWQLGRMQVELEYVNRKLEQQRQLLRMSFALVVGLVAGIQFSLLWMAWTGHYSACFVPPERNVTDDVDHVDMARSLARIIADECFVWLFHE
jgi:hypothetical protein